MSEDLSLGKLLAEALRERYMLKTEADANASTDLEDVGLYLVADDYDLTQVAAAFIERAQDAGLI